MRAVVMVAVVAGLAGCGTVRKADLDSWRGVPVGALDVHSFFTTVPMIRRVTDDGLEIRNYRNGRTSTDCFSNSFGTGKNAFSTTNCMDNETVCNNIFFIREGVVLEYAPRGRCKTDATLRPEPGWQRFQRR